MAKTRKKLTFPDGKYFGETKDGHPSGRGTYTYTDGDKILRTPNAET